MKILILFTLTIFLGLNQSFANILENAYNSLSGEVGLVTGDIDGTAFQIGTTGQFAKDGGDGIAFMFSFEHMDITGISGFNLSGADLEQNSFTYGIGYIFKTDKTHFIPYFAIVDAEVGVNGYSAADYDINTIGFMLRTMISESSAITFLISNSDPDDLTVLGTPVSVSEVSPETTFGFDIESKMNEDSTFNYGASFADGVTAFNFGLTLGF